MTLQRSKLPSGVRSGFGLPATNHARARVSSAANNPPRFSRTRGPEIWNLESIAQMGLASLGIQADPVAAPRDVAAELDIVPGGEPGTFDWKDDLFVSPEGAVRMEAMLP